MKLDTVDVKKKKKVINPHKVVSSTFYDFILNPNKEILLKCCTKK